MLRLLVRLFWLLLIGVPLALIVLAFLAIDQSPMVSGGSDLSSDRVEYARALIKSLDPRGAPVDRIRTLELTGPDVDLLVQQAARRLGVATEVVLQDREALVRVSTPVPTVGGYFNVNAVVGETSAGPPRIESLSVGRVHVPSWLIGRATAFAIKRLSDTELRDVPVDAIRSVSFGDGVLRVEYEWQAGLQERIAALAMPKEDADRLREYHERIREVLDDLPHRASVVDLARPVMKLAASRSASGDPVAENRAALLALGFYVAGTGPAAVVPEAREWMRAQPHAVLLGGRADLTKQFAMSAAQAATAGTPLADVVSKYRGMAASQNSSGATPSSLAADRAGALLGQMAMHSPDTARLLQSRIADGLTEADLLPDLKDLPDSISDAEIRKRFGASEPSSQAALAQEIDRRLKANRLFK